MQPLLIPVILLVLLFCLSAAADEGERGPLWPSTPSARIARVQTPPDLNAPDPLSDPVWREAEVLGPLYSKGLTESADRAADIRLLYSNGTIYLAARCPGATGGPPPEPGEDVIPDALVFYFTQGGGPEFPFIEMQFTSDGACRATRYFRAFGRWKEHPPSADLDTGSVKVRTGVTDAGWWLAAAIPAEEFGIPQRTFRANIARHRVADFSRFAWVDLIGRQAFAPYHFGRLNVVDAPLAPEPRLALPASLAVGANPVRVTDWQPGWRLKVDAVDAAVGPEGAANAIILNRGLHTLELIGPSGEIVQAYSVGVPRPLEIEAAEPFEANLARPVRATVRLNVSDANAIVTLTVKRGPAVVGSAGFTLAPGVHECEIPVKGLKPGDVDILADASLSAGASRINLAARHWCTRGVRKEDVDRFRDRIDDLETRSLYRAGLADACNLYRILQAGDGRYRAFDGDGGLAYSEWNFGMVYAFALIYRADWPENPYRGDERFLASAIAGMEAGLDPATSYPQGAEARNLGAYLLAYELIKDDVPADLADYWKLRLCQIVDEVVEGRVAPITYLYQFYSTDLGTGTNHVAYYCQDVWTAGRIFGRSDWLELGKNCLLALARHGREGHFPERRNVPVTHYTWLSMNALGEYYWQSGDERVRGVLERCAEFCCQTSLPTTETMLVHDGRNNHYSPYYFGDFVLSLTPNGRCLARRRAEKLISSGSKPGDTGPEYWYRTAENALYFEPGPEKPLPQETEYAFLGGRGLIQRRNGFILGLSAICDPPTWDMYLTDAQNTIELHHVDAGHILHGANSQSQPEAGSFVRKIGDRTIFLPIDGSIERADTGRFATLVFDTFKVRLTCDLLSETSAEIEVELLDAVGPEPVVYSFFPAVSSPDELRVGDDGKTLAFRGVRLACNRPVDIERDFRIINPYNQKRTVDTSPVRAYVALEPMHPFVILVQLSK